MRDAAFWIRAFPKRFRRAHGDELLATFEENEGSLGLLAIIDLVRAGWMERWRTHPPLRIWARYRFFGRLPVEWHAWMFDDLDGWVGLRFGAPGLFPQVWLDTILVSRIQPPSHGLFMFVASWLGVVTVTCAILSLLYEMIGHDRARIYYLRRNGYIVA